MYSEQNEKCDQTSNEDSHEEDECPKSPPKPKDIMKNKKEQIHEYRRLKKV